MKYLFEEISWSTIRYYGRSSGVSYFHISTPHVNILVGSLHIYITYFYTEKVSEIVLISISLGIYLQREKRSGSNSVPYMTCMPPHTEMQIEIRTQRNLFLFALLSQEIEYVEMTMEMAQVTPIIISLNW